MRLLKGVTFIDDAFVSGIGPCIALPGPRVSGIETIREHLPLDKAIIKGNNRLIYAGKTFQLFGIYPLLYAPAGKELACFFTNGKVTNPETGETFGDTIWNNGFDEDDMKVRTGYTKCP